MTFGGQTPEDDAFRQLDLAYGSGITLFDTAENYPTPTGPETQGRSEELLGRWIAERGVRDSPPTSVCTRPPLSSDWLIVR